MVLLSEYMDHQSKSDSNESYIEKEALHFICLS